MKGYNCDCEKTIKQGLLETHGYEDVSLPIEWISGKFYIEASITKQVKGKTVKKEIPILLSRCPFCGEKYLEEVARYE